MFTKTKGKRDRQDTYTFVSMEPNEKTEFDELSQLIWDKHINAVNEQMFNARETNSFRDKVLDY